MDGSDHGQPPLDGRMGGSLDLDALIDLSASSRIQEGADKIRSQETSGFVVSQRKMSIPQAGPYWVASGPAPESITPPLSLIHI